MVFLVDLQVRFGAALACAYGAVSTHYTAVGESQALGVSARFHEPRLVRSGAEGSCPERGTWSSIVFSGLPPLTEKGRFCVGTECTVPVCFNLRADRVDTRECCRQLRESRRCGGQDEW